MTRAMTYSGPASMRDRDFHLFSSFIYDQVGIQLPKGKKTMLEARLRKRLKILGMESFADYGDFVFSPAGRAEELVHLIDVVTTNKTDFFREPGHFDFLVKKALPDILRRRGNRLSDPVRVWSAGCSSGEEPYTLSMVLSEAAAGRRDFRFSILASDISTRILETAMTAIYPEDRVDCVDPGIRKKYFLRSKTREKHLVRVCPEVRANVAFRRINFMESNFGIREKMDVIFCRNVIIYFDKATQQTLIRKFHSQLAPGGYLFLGHSETMNGIDIEFRSAGSTVYQKL